MVLFNGKLMIQLHVRNWGLFTPMDCSRPYEAAVSFPAESRSGERRRGVRCEGGTVNTETPRIPGGADSSVGTSGRERRRRRRLGVAGLPVRRGGNGKSPRAPHAETRWRGRLPGVTGWGRPRRGPAAPRGRACGTGRGRRRKRASEAVRPSRGAGQGTGAQPQNRWPSGPPVSPAGGGWCPLRAAWGLR